GVQRQPQPGTERGRGGGLRERPREAVEDEAAVGDRGHHHRGEDVEDGGVGDQVAPLQVRGDVAADGRAGPSLGPQQLPGGDVLHAESVGESFALGPLARAGGREQPQPHRSPSSAGGTISRLRILPVAVLGSASTIHTLRGYLYAETCVLTWSRSSPAVGLGPGLGAPAAPPSSPRTGVPIVPGLRSRSGWLNEATGEVSDRP